VLRLDGECVPVHLSRSFKSNLSAY
jgi:hypothetical protein